MAILDGILTLDELRLENQRVFVRLDLDLPVDPDTATVTDNASIAAAVPTLRRILEAGARVIVGAHLGSPAGKPAPELSLEAAGAALAELGGWDVLLPDDCVGQAPRKVVSDLREGQIALLENLRFRPGEESGDEAFARQLAMTCDVYVNDAPALLHREDASLVALPRLLPDRGCGLLLEQELRARDRLGGHLERPFVAVLGGDSFAAAETLWNSFSARCDTICVGGPWANTLLAARGARLDRSQIEHDRLAEARTLLEHARNREFDLLLPVDLMVSSSADGTDARAVTVGELSGGETVVDVGPRTVEQFGGRLEQARTALWAGALSSAGYGPHSAQTPALVQMLAGCTGFTLVAGEEATAAARSAVAVDAAAPAPGAGEEDAVAAPSAEPAIDLVSWGGDAILRLLQGRRLPGLDALRSVVG